MLPEAMSETLGISLSKVLDLYFRELDEVRRGHLIGDTMDRRVQEEKDHERLGEEFRRRDEVEMVSYREDNEF
jgi:hypothetical protein